MNSNPTWTFKGDVFDESCIEDYVGFVYVITEVSTSKKYIGKKQFWNKVKRPPLKGKKRNRISKKESNWREYFGSSSLVEGILKEKGPEAFTREILYLCKSLTEMSYRELQEQMKNKVLFSDEYYNELIQVRINAKHVKGFDP